MRLPGLRTSYVAAVCVVAAAVFLVSLRSSYAAYTRVVLLTRAGASSQTAEAAEEIRLRIENLFGERLNDLRILARRLRDEAPSRRLETFTNDAEFLTRYEPIYHLINFVDPSSVVRASAAPPGAKPDLVGFDLRTLPGRRDFHLRVREDGVPLLSPPVVLTTGVPGMVLWCPIFGSGGGPRDFLGTVAGTLISDAVVGVLVDQMSKRQFTIRIRSGAEVLYSTEDSGGGGGDPEIPDLIWSTRSRRIFPVLGRKWDVTVTLRETGNYALIFAENRRRFAFQVVLFFLVNVFLCAAVWALARSQEARRRLSDSEERLDLALQGADLGLWDWNIGSGEVSFNRRWAEMLGYDQEDIAPSIETWRNLIHPDDREPVWNRILRHFRGEEPRYEAEQRLRAKNGEWIWVLSKGRVVERDGEGNPLRAAGTHLDITERKRVDADLIATIDEKEMLFKEVHHRVKNNLQIIISLLNLQGAGMKDAEACQAIEECRNRVMAMSLIHEKLYQEGGRELISADDYLRNLCERIFATYNLADRVTLAVDVQDLRLPIDTAIPLGLILNELITNSLKYAFPGGRTGAVRVSLAAVSEETHRLEIRDDGAGPPPDFDIIGAETLGLRLVSSLTSQLRGSVKSSPPDGGGLAVTVEFPAPRRGEETER